MTTYYIDPSATINGTGSFNSPFNTWSAAWSVSGTSDTLLQKRGTTFYGVVLASKNGVSASSPITMGVYDENTGQQVLNKRGSAIIDAQNANIAISLFDRYNIVIDGFEIRNAANYGIYEGHTTGTTDQKADYITSIVIKNCYIHDILNSTLSAIWLQGSGVSYYNILIENCAGDGITHWGQCTGEKVVIKNINNTGGGLGDCLQQQYIRPNTVWKDCIFDHSNSPQKQCIVFGNGTLIDASNSVLDNCVLIGPQIVEGAGSLSIDFVSGLTIKRNKIIAGKGIYVLGSTSNVVIESNLIFGFGDNSIGIGSAVNATVTARQNTIVSHQRSIELLGTNNIASNNLLIGSGGTPITAISFSGNFIDVSGNSLVTSYYTLKSSSPCIASGSNIGVVQDKNRTTFQNPPSIGAYEYIRPRAAALTRTMRT